MRRPSWIFRCKRGPYLRNLKRTLCFWGILSTASLPAYCQLSDLISYWPGENTADDAVGSNHGILVNDTSFDLGVNGYAFSFDGEDDMVLINDDVSLRPAEVTVAAWVKFTSTDSQLYGGAVFCCPGFEYILFKRNSRITFFEGYTLYKFRDGDGYALGFGVTSALGEQGSATFSAPEIQPDTWYHVAGSYDGQYVGLYVNGELKARNFLGFPLDHSTQPLVIGRSGQDGEVGEGNFDAAFRGLIDEVVLYPRALMESEVRDLYISPILDRIEDLSVLVFEYNLQQGIESSLDAKLAAALNTLDDLNENNDVAACNSLQAFINAVEAQRGDKISDTQADDLIESVLTIMQLVCVH